MLFFISLLPTQAVTAQTFKVADKSVAVDYFKQVASKTVEVIDPNESQPGKPVKIKFHGFHGLKFVDRVFGNRGAWSKSKEIVFECADGYKPTLPTVEFPAGNYYFATSREGSKEFSLVNNLKDGKKVALGPYYIVWTDKNYQTKEEAHYWPYQVVAISVHSSIAPNKSDGTLGFFVFE